MKPSKKELRAAVAAQERIITNLAAELESSELSNQALRNELAFWCGR